MTHPNAVVFLLLALSACRPSSPGGAPTDPEAVESEVRAASLAGVDALNAHDADRILGFYRLDDTFTQVACTAVRSGGPAFANLTRALHTQFKDVFYDMTCVRVQHLGPDAAAVALQGTMLDPLFVTRVLRKEADGRWLVVYEHESWPGCPSPVAPHPGTGPAAAAAMGNTPDSTRT